jgi:predicted ATPase/DNA-binding SARP family transcriptional activator
VRIALLGPLEVCAADGRPVHLGGWRLRALLARLALDAGREVAVDALVDGLWGAAPPAGALNALQSLVSRLRRALPDGPAVELGAAGYRLAAGPDEVDAHRFERLAAQGRAALASGEARRAVGALRAAEALWRGPALADVVQAPFAAAAVTRLDELRLAATEDRIEAELTAGPVALAELVTEAARLADAHPLRERMHGLLVRALYASGRQGEALAAYARLRDSLADELGVDPSPELAELHLAVLRQDPSLSPGSGPAPRTNLRAQLTSFVGRDEELRRVGKLLAGSRLVTVVGSGGAGKTRLATELAGRCADLAPDGIWMVELAAVTEEQDVVQAALSALGVRETALLDNARMDARADPRREREPVRRLATSIGGRSVLVVLDNCEHVVLAAAQLADALLAACPRLRVVATSREQLGVAGEVLYQIPPLDWPPDREDPAARDYPAVRLFAERAAAVRPDFAVTAENLADVVEVCRRLDGMPLAIELAAARLRSLSVAQVAARLDDRFRLLTGGVRTALPRHQTLRAVVEWSWDLLDEDERVLARRLSVFPGGATLEAVEDVCAGPGLPREDVLGTLAALVDKSLVEVSDQRYRMLETVRAYGAERLAEAGELDALHGAHARHFTALAEAAEPRIRSHEQLEWIARLGAEQGNLTAALRWAVDAGDADLAVRLTAALGWYWFVQGRRAESRPIVAEVVALPGEAPAAARALTLSFAGMLTISGGDFEEGQAMLAAAVEHARRADPRAHPMLPIIEPAAAIFLPDHDEALRRVEAVLPSLHGWGRAMALMFHGFLLDNEGDADAARDDLAAAHAEFTAVGDRWGMALTTRALAGARTLDGDHSGAIAAHLEALELVEALGSLDDVPEIMALVAVEGARLGDLAAARDGLAQARRIAERAGNVEATIWAMCGQGEVSVREGDLAAARAVLDEALVLVEKHLVGPPQVRAIVTAGLAGLDVLEGDAACARARLDAAIEDAVGAADMPVLANTVDVAAALALLDGDAERAALLLGTGTRLRGRPDRSHQDLLRTEERARGLLGARAFEAAYRRGVEQSREEAIAQVRPQVRRR